MLDVSAVGPLRREVLNRIKSLGVSLDGMETLTPAWRRLWKLLNVPEVNRTKQVGRPGMSQ